MKKELVFFVTGLLGGASFGMIILSLYPELENFGWVFSTPAILAFVILMVTIWVESHAIKGDERK